jgi:2-dehydropantoate 2-reductase
VTERILVAGCGAVGSVFAGLLAGAGHRVTILGRSVTAITKEGLTISGIWGDHRAREICALERAGDLSRSYDAVLVTCKSYQTEALLADIGRRVGADGVVISLQNGLGNVERLQAVYGRESVLVGRVIFGAELDAPGRARVTVEAEPVLLGHPDDRADPGAEKWAATFHSAGIRCSPTTRVTSAIWGKVFYNAALNPLGALLGMSYGELASDLQRREVMSGVIGEAFAVATAERVELAWHEVGEYLDTFYDRLVPATADHRSSMLQDIEKGRPTEIDAICGEICRRGSASGVATPLNRLLGVLVAARSARAQAR